MLRFLLAFSLCLSIGAGFWYALTSTLTDMTKADCLYGVQSACDQLKRDGVQP